MSAGDVEELAVRFERTRSEADFRAFHRAVAAQLWAFALRLCGWDEDDASDLVQETWLRAVRGLSARKGQSQFMTWLLGIAVRADSERRRKRRAEPRDPRSLEPAARDTTIDTALDLERACAALTDGMRRIFLLHDLEGRTHVEIGELLGISPGTSKSQLHEARKRMRALLSDEDDDDEQRWNEGDARPG